MLSLVSSSWQSRACEVIMLLFPVGKHFCLCMPEPANSFLCTTSYLTRMSSIPEKVLKWSLWLCLVVLASCMFFHGIVAPACIYSACLVPVNFLTWNFQQWIGLCMVLLVGLKKFRSMLIPHSLFLKMYPPWKKKPSLNFSCDNVCSSSQNYLFKFVDLHKLIIHTRGKKKNQGGIKEGCQVASIK